MTMGPLQLVIVGFNKDVMKTNVLDELFEVSKAGTIRLIDFLVIEKDEDGHVWSVDLGGEEGDEVDVSEDTLMFGSIIGDLIDLGAEEMENPERDEAAQILSVADNNFGLTPQQVNEMAYQLPNGSSALIGLFEHTWAVSLRESIVKADGVMLAQGMLNPDGMLSLSDKLIEGQRLAEADEAAAG